MARRSDTARGSGTAPGASAAAGPAGDGADRGAAPSEPRGVEFELLHPDAVVPRRSTRLSAGYDVRAYLQGRRVRVRRAASDGSEEVSPAVETKEERARSGAPGGRPRLRLEPGDRALIPTGFKARLPAGYEAQIRIRSSVAWKKGLVVPNAPGTVDADYPDEWFVLVQNGSARSQAIEHGERIAQIVIARHEVLPWREGRVERSTDRTGGLGSTGR